MKRLERIFHILAFSLQCGALIPMLLRTDSNTSDLGAANPLNTALTAGVLAVVAVLMLLHARAVFQYAGRMWPLLGLVLLALLSATWSDFPDVTIRRAASFLTATLWAWYVAARYDPDDVFRIIKQSIGFLALASLAIAVLAPDIGRDDAMGPPGWRGVFANKNDLGVIMAFGVVTFFYDLSLRGSKFVYALASLGGLALCTLLLYLSESRTCWLIGLLGPFLCVAIRLTYRRVGMAVIIWAALLLLLAPGAVLVADQLPAIAPLIGRDATLTGRVDLWLILPSYIAERPWLGYGFGGFWVADSTNVYLIWGTIGWPAPHAHDGWLDVTLDLGFVGLGLIGLQVVLILMGGIGAIVNGREQHAQFVVLTTFLVLIYNIAESNLARPGVMWVFVVIAATVLAKVAKQRPRALAEPRQGNPPNHRPFIAAARPG